MFRRLVSITLLLVFVLFSSPLGFNFAFAETADEALVRQLTETINGLPSGTKLTPQQAQSIVDIISSNSGPLKTRLALNLADLRQQAGFSSLQDYFSTLTKEQLIQMGLASPPISSQQNFQQVPDDSDDQPSSLCSGAKKVLGVIPIPKFFLNPGTCLLVKVSEWIGAVVVSFANILFKVAFAIIPWSVHLSDLVFGEGAIGIRAGWDASLQVVNIGFVITIIIIAFATMLRRESYGMRTLLPKLIAVALLINFSFVITRTLVTISDSLSVAILEQVSLDPVTFSKA